MIQSNTVSKIIAFESGEMDLDEVKEFFADLSNCGTLAHLQGSYARTFHTLVSSGHVQITNEGKAIACDVDE